jgi:hypothetical protein
MEIHIDDFALTIKADDLDVPYHLQDEPLFLTIRPYLIDLLSNKKTVVFHFGYTPDNTADTQDELLENGIFL